ncbi:S1C family serine protease [Verrucomicrobiota bacterium sgz303538]
MYQIFVHKNGDQLGPFDEESLRKAIDAGHFNREDLGTFSQDSHWQQLHVLLDLNSSSPPPFPGTFKERQTPPTPRVPVNTEMHSQRSRSKSYRRLVTVLLTAIAAASTTAWIVDRRGPQKAKDIPLESMNFPADLIAQVYADRVFEVRATWKERGGLLWLQTITRGSMGSAVMVSSNENSGTLLTNWHVVACPESAWDHTCEVKTAQMTGFVPARITARGKNGLDLAVLQIDISGKWDPLNLPFKGISDLQAGQDCVAIGNTLGQGLSVTTGTISRLDQDGGITMIRTSTPVSHGNSGGPLFARTGAALIGIVTQGLSANQAQNVNWAIPIEYARDSNNWEVFDEPLGFPKPQ